MKVSRNTVLSRAAAVLALPQTWTVFAVLLVASLSLWGWWLVPARWPRWVAVTAFLPHPLDLNFSEGASVYSIG